MAATGSGEKLKVFISYSRRDSSEFADELVDGLELAGFAPFLDRHDIAPGEKWEDRLGGLISQADTVVFVVSSEAVKSERCAWEVEQTLRLSKRLLPVVFKLVAEADLPETLRERQFVRFDVAAGITRPLRELAEALRHDIDWIREHTRIGEMAARWEARGRLPSLLLRGDDVVAAEVWMKNRKADAPTISDVMQAFIAASKDADAAFLVKASIAEQKVAQSRRLVAVLSATFVAVLMVVLTAWWQEDWLKEREAWLKESYAAVWLKGSYAAAKERIYSFVNVHPLKIAQEGALKPGGPPFKECTDCPEMVVVPAGSFMMGSSEDHGNRNEHPQHKVTITKPLAVSKYELTFAEWDACWHHGGCPHVDDNDFSRGQQPVINVSWDEAKEYVSWLSKITGKTYRLLTEAEYEYAVRAGTLTAYPWGDDIKLDGAVMANCDGCGSQWDHHQTAPVGSFSPNKFGLYDMVGNVFEWTEDCTHNSYDEAPIDGSAWIAEGPKGVIDLGAIFDHPGPASGDCSIRIVRGGAWFSHPDFLRSAFRYSQVTDYRYNNLGFRVARTLTAP
jgi:formylglycine-generating enzyme required for sulfatase activity